MGLSCAVLFGMRFTQMKCNTRIEPNEPLNRLARNPCGCQAYKHLHVYVCATVMNE